MNREQGGVLYSFTNMLRAAMHYLEAIRSKVRLPVLYKPATPPNAATYGRVGSSDIQRTAELVTGIAHELKAPLTAILFSSELLGVLELLDSSPDKQKEALIQNVSTNARKVNRRICELLDYLDMQVGVLHLEPQAVEMAPLLAEIKAQLAPSFGKKNQTFILNLPENLPPVKADKDRLQLILTNLLENANELSPVDTEIGVQVKQIGKKIVLEVKDSAPALTDEETGRLFDLCYSGNGSMDRQGLPCLGPGLAVSRKLIELQQGEIWVESDLEQGNTFAFSLPLASEVDVKLPQLP